MLLLINVILKRLSSKGNFPCSQVIFRQSISDDSVASLHKVALKSCQDEQFWENIINSLMHDIAVQKLMYSSFKKFANNPCQWLSPIIPKYSSRGHVQQQLILLGRGKESNELNRNKLLAELNEWGENENLQPLLKFKDEKKKE